MPAIVEFPTVVKDALEQFGAAFANEPERRHFAEYLTGLMVADRYDAAVMREPSTRPLAPARRKSELLRFARRAARRLSAQIDPSLGDAC